MAAAPYAWPWNVLGWPGVNVPAGLTPAGLPVGASLLGPANSEPRLIALAAQLEAVERWRRDARQRRRRPPTYHPENEEIGSGRRLPQWCSPCLRRRRRTYPSRR